MKNTESIVLKNLNTSPSKLDLQQQRATFGGKYVEGACTSKGFCISRGKDIYGAATFYIDPANLPFPSGFLLFNDGSIEPLE